MRFWRGAMLGGVVGLWGCVYTFNNPVETTASGTLSGQVVLVDAAPDQTVATGRVKVLWSGGLTVPLDSTGRFAFIGLPDGVYTVSYEVPPLAANDLALNGIRPNVVIPIVAGQPNAVDLKSLSLAAGATLRGTVTHLDGAAVVAAFAPDGGVYEGYSTNVAADGTYSLQVPAGSHDLVASTATSSATLTITVAPGANQTQPLTLTPAIGGAQVTGQIVFGGPGLGASTPAPMAFTSGIGFAATGGADGGTANGPVPVTTSASGSQSVQLQAAPAAGQVVNVTLTLPAQVALGSVSGPQGQAEGPYGPLTLPQLPLIAGRSTDLGQITWLPLATFAQNGIDAGL